MDIGEEMGQAQGEGLAGLGIEAGGIETANLHGGGVLAAGHGRGRHQAPEGHALGAAAVVNTVGCSVYTDAGGHGAGQVIDMAQLGDRGAITGQGYRPAVDDAIKEPALHRVVVAGADDVGGPEAGEGDRFGPQPGLRFRLTGMAAGRIDRGLLIQGPELAVGIHPRRTHIDEAMARGTGLLDHGPAVVQAAAGAVDDDVEAPARQQAQALGRGAIALDVVHPLR